MVQLTLVTPDWLPLALAGGLLVLLGLLYWSLRHTLDRIAVEREREPPATPVSPAEVSTDH